MQTEDILKKRAKLAFILYMLCLFWIVILKCNLRPGVLESRYTFEKLELIDRFAFFLGRFASTNIREATLNVLIFIPVGITLPFVLNKDSKKKADKRLCLKSALVGVAISLCAEVCQIIVAIGGFTYVDIINNSIGALIGAFLHLYLTNRLKDTHTVKSLNCAIIGMIGVLIFAAVNTILNIEIYFLPPGDLL